MNWRAAVGYGCSSLLILFGFVMIGGMALTVGEGKKTGSGDVVMLLLFGGVPTVLGIWWLVRTIAAGRRVSWEQTERKVLHYAMQCGGVVTAMQVAAETDLSFDEVTRYLNHLADQGHVEVTPTDQGLAYRFPNSTRA